jgi:hypothetical protein
MSTLLTFSGAWKASAQDSPKAMAQAAGKPKEFSSHSSERFESLSISKPSISSQTILNERTLNILDEETKESEGKASLREGRLRNKEPMQEGRLNGGGSDGGGFAYYYTSGAHFRSLKRTLSRLIENHPVEDLRKLEEKYHISIDWKEFANIIRSAKANATKFAERQNPDGEAEPLIMNYNRKERSIAALGPFFEIFNKEELTAKEVEKMKILILHETSHLYNLGVNNDDDASRAFAKDLIEVLFRYEYRCKYDPDHPLECQYEVLKGNPDLDPMETLILKSAMIGSNGKEEMIGPCQRRLDVWRPDMASGFKLVEHIPLRMDHKTAMSIEVPASVQSGDVLSISEACFPMYISGGTVRGKYLFNIQDHKGQSVLKEPIFYESKTGIYVTQISIRRTDDGKFIYYGGKISP